MGKINITSVYIMDYLSTLQNLGGLASSYETDLNTRFGDINMDNQLQNTYSNAMGDWSSTVEALKSKGIDELKDWGIEAGSELGIDALARGYSGSALQGAIGDYISSAKSSIKGGLESAFQTGKTAVSDFTEAAPAVLSDAVGAITQGAQGLARDFANSSFLPGPAQPETMEMANFAESGAEPTTTLARADAAPEFQNPLFDKTAAGEAEASTAVDLGEDTGARGVLSATDVNALTYPAAGVGNTAAVESAGAAATTTADANATATATFNAESADYAAKDYSGMENLEGNAGKEGGDTAAEEGETFGETIGEDAVEDTALDATGVGEVLMAGQIIYSGIKAVVDFFDPPKPPPPPKMPVLAQIPQMPAFLQASVQSGV